MNRIGSTFRGLAARCRNWRSPQGYLVLMTVAMPFSFATWQALLNNFAVDHAGFTGVEIGFLQSLREVPGFLSFAVVFLLLILREQKVAVLSILLLGAGTALTGFFPTILGLYMTTVLMSLGYHYFETAQQSLTLQWVDKEQAPHFMGRLISVRSFSALAVFGIVHACLEFGGLDLKWVYLAGGGATVAVGIFAWASFPHFPARTEQHKKLIVRPQYWLFYALTFMAGARRQIFIVFAGFMMVEKFGFQASSITLLFLINSIFTIFAAPQIGKFIGKWGERRALTVEYIGLIAIFTAYAFVEVAWLAAVLFILDHIFFSMRIAIKTYFQKIANPADIAGTMGVSFTINHVASVVIPAVFGLVWVVSPPAVFLAGAVMAALSLGLARLVPYIPAPDNVTIWRRYRMFPGPAE